MKSGNTFAYFLVYYVYGIIFTSNSINHFTIIIEKFQKLALNHSKCIIDLLHITFVQDIGSRSFEEKLNS